MSILRRKIAKRMKKTQFKQDIYTQNRKNYSEFLNLHCRKCNAFITKYQKDGPGALLRIYVDRIINKDKIGKFKVDKKLTCPHCKRLLGLGYIYPKEQRPSYILFHQTVVKKPISNIRHLWCLGLSLLK